MVGILYCYRYLENMYKRFACEKLYYMKIIKYGMNFVAHRNTFTIP